MSNNVQEHTHNEALRAFVASWRRQVAQSGLGSPDAETPSSASFSPPTLQNSFDTSIPYFQHNNPQVPALAPTPTAPFFPVTYVPLDFWAMSWCSQCNALTRGWTAPFDNNAYCTSCFLFLMKPQPAPSTGAGAHSQVEPLTASFARTLSFNNEDAFNLAQTGRIVDFDPSSSASAASSSGSHPNSQPVSQHEQVRIIQYDPSASSSGSYSLSPNSSAQLENGNAASTYAEEGGSGLPIRENEGYSKQETPSYGEWHNPSAQLETGNAASTYVEESGSGLPKRENEGYSHQEAQSHGEWHNSSAQLEDGNATLTYAEESGSGLPIMENQGYSDKPQRYEWHNYSAQDWNATPTYAEESSSGLPNERYTYRGTQSYGEWHNFSAQDGNASTYAEESGSGLPIMQNEGYHYQETQTQSYGEWYKTLTATSV